MFVSEQLFLVFSVSPMNIFVRDHYHDYCEMFSDVTDVKCPPNIKPSVVQMYMASLQCGDYGDEELRYGWRNYGNVKKQTWRQDKSG